MPSLSDNSTHFHRTRRPIEVLGSRGRDIYQTMFCEECHLQIRPGGEITVVRGDGGSRPDGLKVMHLGCAHGYEPLSETELEAALDEIYGERATDREVRANKGRRNR
jgi:hypothetical protein